MSAQPQKQSTTISPTKLAALLAIARARKESTNGTITSDSNPSQNKESIETNSNSEPHSEPNNSDDINSNTLNDDSCAVDRNGNVIQYNEEQLSFVRIASSGESAVLIGPAGTGKTTCMRGALESLIQSGRVGILDNEDHKHLVDGTPGIVVISFTRRAVANIRKNLSEDLKANCLTYHALMEYEPEYFDVIDPVTGEEKKSMRFIATRNGYRPLPTSIKCCVIEEASMFSLEFFNELKVALPASCQYIFLGDIQQLPPVFGSAILGYKMLELPTIELKQVYRQALESPIIRLAHRILSGTSIPASEYPEWKFPGKLTLHPWKKKIDSENATFTLAKFLRNAIDSNAYDPAEDMILMPFNKAFGTIEINKAIAQHLSRKRNAIVWEVIAGFNKLYLSIGDKILYDKEDAVIVNITKNLRYTGASPQAESKDLDYWGCNQGDSPSKNALAEVSDDDIDFLLEQSAASGDSEDRVRQASHIVTLRMSETDVEVTLDAAGDLNALLLGYALTVHKSQGSEFRRVFMILHQSHATMLQRELLYTGVTRAREELYIICEPESFTAGIKSQRIKGNTLAEKAEYFKGKIESGSKIS
jgi:exodeoxyribonuclease V alpha subunit